MESSTGFGSKGGAMSMNPLKLQEMMSQAKAMQEQLQQKMMETVVEANAGGGAVSVRMNGQKHIQKLTIDPSAVLGLSGNAADVEMLEDLIVAAVNDAGRRVDEAMKSGLSGMLGGLNLPPGLI
jgi:nucleoid-associated protein EbfC